MFLNYQYSIRICLILLLVFQSTFLLSQTKTASGVVTHQGKAVEAALIYIENHKSNAVNTSPQGTFVLQLPETSDKNFTLIAQPPNSTLEEYYSIPNENQSNLSIELRHLENPYVQKKKDENKNPEENEETKVNDEKQDNDAQKNVDEEPSENNGDNPETTSRSTTNPDKKKTIPDKKRPSDGFQNLTNDIESLTLKIDTEQQKMIERQTEILDEIDHITEKLLNAKDLTPEQKKTLSNQLTTLNDRLKENSERFQELREETEAKINEMRQRLGKVEKESKFNLTLAFIFLGISLLLIIVLTIVFYVSRKIKKQNNIISDVNLLLAQQGKEIATKNKQTENSIKAARAIQKSILPTENLINENLGEQFIIYIPKDIVSGDFYWIKNIENYTFVAVVDCTGHGVPGAFVSMIGYSLLNEITVQRKIYEPAKILELLHQYVFERLQQEFGENNDGMDVCLIRITDIDQESKQITFTGAKRPLFISEQHDIKVIRGTNRSIGGALQSDKNFENEEIILRKGDALYLTSDGFADAHNPERKSFGNKKLLSLLKEMTNKPMSEQKQILLKELEEYQENESPRDDITFIGIKI